MLDALVMIFGNTEFTNWVFKQISTLQVYWRGIWEISDKSIGMQGIEVKEIEGHNEEEKGSEEGTELSLVSISSEDLMAGLQ